MHKRSRIEKKQWPIHPDQLAFERGVILDDCYHKAILELHYAPVVHAYHFERKRTYEPNIQWRTVRKCRRCKAVIDLDGQFRCFTLVRYEHTGLLGTARLGVQHTVQRELLADSGDNLTCNFNPTICLACMTHLNEFVQGLAPAPLVELLPFATWINVPNDLMRIIAAYALKREVWYVMGQ